jgi:dihydrodipicolinate synthase/N-acetylneuraminate lyase
MDLNGYYGGPLRLPLLPLTPAARTELEELFAEIKG